MDRLDQVLGDLLSDLKRAEHLLQLVKSFREFGGSAVPNLVTEHDTGWQEAVSLWEGSKKHRTDLPILSGSLFLYLVGRFEYFVRQVVETVAEDMVDEANKYADLPEALTQELKSRTLEVAQNPRRYGFDEGQATTFLASLVGNLAGEGNPLRISPEVLSITESNMTDRVLADVLKRLGMAKIWPELGKQARLKNHLESAADGDTTAKAQALLNSLMKERNQIAHPTGSLRFPGPDQVLEKAAFLKLLSELIVEIVRVHFTEFRNQDRA